MNTYFPNDFTMYNQSPSILRAADPEPRIYREDTDWFYSTSVPIIGLRPESVAPIIIDAALIEVLIGVVSFSTVIEPIRFLLPDSLGIEGALAKLFPTYLVGAFRRWHDVHISCG
jgi:hypothetical protein